MPQKAMFLIVVCVLLGASFVHAGEPQPRTISTSGAASIFVPPDRAVIRFEVHTFDADLAKARAMNDDACKAVLKIVQSMGVELKDIQTDRLRADPVYDYDEEFKGQQMQAQPLRPKKLTGYTTGRSYVARLKDLTQFENLTSTLLVRTDCTLGKFEFETSELRKHRDAARKMAARAAKEKAVALATELDSKVGKARTINEASETFYDMRLMNSQNHVEFEPAPEVNETTPLGQIIVRATINVTFDLE